MLSLCFPEAYEQYASKKISWEEYLRHGLMHYVQGFVPHENETILNRKELREKDAFGYTLWTYQFHCHPVKDVSQLEAIFHAYSNGSVDDLKSKLQPLRNMTANSMRKPLALMALRDRKLDMLEYIINDGQVDYDPPTNRVFEKEAHAVDKDREPELFNIIRRSGWMVEQERRAQEKARNQARGEPEGGATPFSRNPHGYKLPPMENM